MMHALLLTSDVTAWTFNVEVGAMLSFSISGVAPTYAYGDLEITPTAIIFNSDGTTYHITEFGANNDCVGFDEVQCNAPAAYYYVAENILGMQSHNTLAGPLTIATATPVPATPLPAALPLFATGLGRDGSVRLAQEAEERCCRRSLLTKADIIRSPSLKSELLPRRAQDFPLPPPAFTLVDRQCQKFP